MDLDFTKYLIGLFKSYYPNFLNYIIVFDMAWVLNGNIFEIKRRYKKKIKQWNVTSAAFKIIKSWLPPKAVDKIKLVDKKSLKEFIPLDQCLVSWGGSDNYGFEFEPEVFPSKSDDVRKKVPSQHLY